MMRVLVCCRAWHAPGARHDGRRPEVTKALDHGARALCRNREALKISRPSVENTPGPNVIGQARHVAAPRTGETTMKYLVMIYASEAD